MKLYLQYTNDIDRWFIKEAKELKSETDAMEKKWEFIGAGLFKKAFKKGNVVVKFNKMDGSEEHMLREVELYMKASKRHKKHMARIFGGNGKKIIQRFVNGNRINSDEEFNEVSRVAGELGITDYGYYHNVVKTKKGIVFYDFSGHALKNKV